MTLEIIEARSDTDYHKAYPIILQLFPWLDMQTYAQRVFVARATGYRMFIGKLGDDFVGVIGMMPNHNIHDGFVTYIEHVVVDKKHRGKGYGVQLLEFAEERAQDEGCDLIELDVDDDNIQVTELYLKSGYEKSGSYYYKKIASGPYDD
jgi:ribosomal protein S18 acetylase RimI-like enzyme